MGRGFIFHLEAFKDEPYYGVYVKLHIALMDSERPKMAPDVCNCHWLREMALFDAVRSCPWYCWWVLVL